ncbi:MAG TPA: hypothetical protein PLA79_05900 [Bacteroidales bacterium]|nr:hypothetical protein [Bacteroidales bacterium]
MENLKEHPLYRKHTLDTVMSSLWEFYRKKFLVLFITSFILSVTTHLLMLNFNLTELQNFTDPMEVLEKVRGMILPIAIISVISLYFTVVLQYYVICNPVDRDITILSSTYKSLKYFLPYLIIIILLSFFGSIVLALGLLVFIIGIFFAALYIATLYMFFLPVLIVEGTDIGNAIARTFSLVHKRFWINIGWVAVFIVILMVLSVILSGLILIPFSGSFLKIMVNPEEASTIMDFASNPLYIILSSAANALYLPALPIFAAILYFHGRASDEPVTNP